MTGRNPLKRRRSALDCRAISEEEEEEEDEYVYTVLYCTCYWVLGNRVFSNPDMCFNI
jgi:hypothetical protein